MRTHKMFTGGIQHILQRQIQRLYAEVRIKVSRNSEQNFEFQVYMTMAQPLQGQEDDQPVEVTTPENAIDDDVVDIRTIYPP